MKRKQQRFNASLCEVLKSTDLKIGDKEGIGSLIGKAISELATEDHRRHGMRIENMFAYMAGALGNCTLIKQEDSSGLCLVSDEKIKIPDYRVVLKSNELFLVEVKNSASHKILFKENYIESLKKYASLNNCALKMAVYWSRLKVWTLVSTEWFAFERGKYALTMDQAIAMSEMAKLGDCMIATTAPLTLRLLMDEGKTSKIDKEGKCLFTIGNVQMFCAGNLIVEKLEQDIAFQLILSSFWEEEENVEIVDDKIAYVEYKYSPTEINENQGFSIIGFLSSIISEKFNSSTVYDGEIERFAPQLEPEQFKIFIPDNYKGSALPIWRFIIKPNKGYKGLTKATEDKRLP